MKINWFSPVLPDRSGIASVTSNLLPVMSSQAELTLWTNNENYDRELEQYAKIQHYHNANYWHYGDLQLLNDADATIYNIGNNAGYHSNIWCASQYYSGIVILHDMKLFDLFRSICMHSSNGKNSLIKLASTFYNSDSKKIVNDILNSKVALDSVANKVDFAELALRNAKAVIVHSLDTFEQLKQICSIPVYYLNLPYKIKKEKQLIKLKKKKRTYRLILFGRGLDNRRVISILKALSRFAKKKQFTLDVIGKVVDKQVIFKAIKALGISKIVQYYEHLPDAMLDKFLSNADLAFNLRYPTMGEASYSQLTIWEHSLPSLVTNIGYYRNLPTHTVAHVNIESEIDDIIKILADFIQYPEKYWKMGEAGRAYLEQWSNPQDYVQSIIEIIKVNSNLNYIKRMMVQRCAQRNKDFHVEGHEKRIIKTVLGLLG